MTGLTSIFSLATVTDISEFSKNGQFWATIDVLGEGEEPINYTSPYATRTEGAQISIPFEGTRVMVCQPAGQEKYFYIGATFLEDEPPIYSPEDERLAEEEVGPSQHILAALPNLYSMRDRPMQMCFKGPRGNGLIISEQTQGDPKACNIKTELIGQSGKKVQINDSPGIDSILIKNDHGDGITVTSEPKALGMMSRAISLESHGPQTYLNREGQTNHVVYDGTELNIQNHSTGKNKDPNEPMRYGNVNIESKTHDVNIMSRKDSGRIFIKCINKEGDHQIIDIETMSGTDSTIRVKSTGKLELIADGDRGIDVVSGGDINLKATGDINLDSGGKINLKCSDTVNVDGSKTYLQTGTAGNSTDDVSSEYTGIYEPEGILP